MAGSARAAEITDVASSFDTGNVFDFRLRVGYEYSTKSAAIKREHEGDPTQTAVQVLKDLVYQQQRNSMALRAEIGLYHDLMLTVGLPFVIDDSRGYSYDQRLGAECVYSGANANCVNDKNSLTTNSDAPAGTSATGMANYFIVPSGGYDAQNSGAAISADTKNPASMVFRGPKRGGSGGDLFDTLDLGLTYGIFTQARDDTKPTWLISAAYRVSVGNVMRFDRAKPDANHGVSDGLDHFAVNTSLSRRYRFVEPYTQLWFDYPFARRSDSLFFDYGPTAKNQAPQASGGVVFGAEVIPWERAKDSYKVSIDLAGRITGKFDGRGYSEAWELFAGSPALACDATWNPSCSAKSIDPSTMQAWNGTSAYAGKPYTGITTIQNYAVIGAQVAVAVQASKWFRLRLWFNYQHDQTHLITVDDVGIPQMAGARISKPAEYNPAFRPIINEVGRRYIADNPETLSFGVYGQAMF